MGLGRVVDLKVVAVGVELPVVHGVEEDVSVAQELGYRSGRNG